MTDVSKLKLSLEEYRRRAVTATERRRAQADEAFEARMEDLCWLLRSGESPDAVATRLGVSPAALARQLYRRGETDLARLFQRGACRAR